MSFNAIEIHGLKKAYQRKTVLNDLHLSVPAGSVLGLLGRNGEGKTTLIKCLLGLLKPTQGDIMVLADHPWDFQESTKEKIGYVPQADRLYPWLTVQQLLDYTASFYQHWNESLVKRLLSEWRVDAREKVGLLSEGQAQKVSIILSLGHEPELLVFDEPVASLDPGARRQFLKTILEIVSGRTCTIFFSTHITSDLERVADRVAILNAGQITVSGELEAIKDEVKRLRIQASLNLPHSLGLSGVVHEQIDGQQAIITVKNFNPVVLRHIQQTFKAQVDVEDLNLEEIFLELSR